MTSTLPCYAVAAPMESIDEGSRPDANRQLVEALAAGEPESVLRVYRTHQQQVRRFAQRLLGSEADAEELVQEVFLELSRAVRQFQWQSSLSTFIMGIAVNRARKLLRAGKRRHAALTRLHAVTTLGNSVEEPDDALERQRLASVLVAAMEELTEDQRIAFVLSEVDERPSSEVAAILGIPSSTVRSRVQAARLKLRATLAERGQQ